MKASSSYVKRSMTATPTRVSMWWEYELSSFRLLPIAITLGLYSCGRRSEKLVILQDVSMKVLTLKTAAKCHPAGAVELRQEAGNLHCVRTLVSCDCGRSLPRWGLYSCDGGGGKPLLCKVFEFNLSLGKADRRPRLGRVQRASLPPDYKLTRQGKR